MVTLIKYYNTTIRSSVTYGSITTLCEKISHFVVKYFLMVHYYILLYNSTNNGKAIHEKYRILL